MLNKNLCEYGTKHYTYIVLDHHHLQSSSTISIVALPTAPTLQSAGSEDGSIVMVKVSLPSNILSSFIGTLNEALVSPARNVTVYGPEV